MLQKNPLCPLPSPTCWQQEKEQQGDWSHLFPTFQTSRSHVVASSWWVLISEILLQGNVGKYAFKKFFLKPSHLCSTGGHAQGELLWVLIADLPFPPRSLKQAKMCTRTGNPWVLLLFPVPCGFHLDKWIFPTKVIKIMMTLQYFFYSLSEIDWQLPSPFSGIDWRCTN